tara:strand:- start:366 stop:1181 length:816 start_codon:yes stop_codon:yes gene_type:complete
LKVPDNIIGIWGAPRSGTSWLGQIFNSSPNTLYRYQPLFSYKYRNRLSKSSTKKEIEEFFSDIINTDDNFVINGLASTKEISLLDFDKSINPTHLVMKHVRYMQVIENLILRTNNLRVVAIIRHPCAAINSWLKSPKEFNPKWNIHDEWVFAKKKNEEDPNQYFGYKKWKETTILFERLNQKYPKNFTIIKYSKLLSNTHGEIIKLFGKLDLEIFDVTIDFIGRSSSMNFDDSYSVFKKKNNDNNWKTELYPLIIEKIINDLSGTSLNKYL